MGGICTYLFEFKEVKPENLNCLYHLKNKIWIQIINNYLNVNFTTEYKNITVEEKNKMKAGRIWKKEKKNRVWMKRAMTQAQAAASALLFCYFFFASRPYYTLTLL